ncbi:MAG: type II secretion system protein [Candidatus Cloacimonetes bacterium]|nr:type II secretion system protein [Candidatus Cloacimonadota bacterium]MBL7086197.1 type II secretion system protein [Candidatus Cloacimonadota bacterium]
MIKHYLTSEKGFGIIQALITLVIISAAIAGIFVSSFYARKKANENYHYRAALLAANDKIERIKCHNRYTQGRPDIETVPKINAPIILDPTGNTNLNEDFDIYISPIPTTDLDVAIYAVYEEIIVTVTWEEPSKLFFNPQSKNTKTLMLREDYFRRSDISSE